MKQAVVVSFWVILHDYTFRSVYTSLSTLLYISQTNCVLSFSKSNFLPENETISTGLFIEKHMKPRNNKILLDNITKTYKRGSEDNISEINNELKHIASKLLICN